MRELEVKFEVDNIDDIIEKFSVLENWISKNNQTTEIDKLFLDKKSRLKNLKNKNILRIREERNLKEENSIFTLNLKRFTKSRLDRIEHECFISNPVEMEFILNQLGFNVVLSIEKIRKKFFFHPYNICFDKVKLLGHFVEFELLTEENLSYESFKNDCIVFMRNLGFENLKIVDKPYDYLLSEEIEQ